MKRKYNSKSDNILLIKGGIDDVLKLETRRNRQGSH